ncbi:MAG: aromatic-ring-hydroxylating dioxygenase subunit beta [Comamonas sp.]
MQLLDRSFDHSTAATAAAPAGEDLRRGVERFLQHEARLLDERRFSDWLGLWTEQGRYWVPRFHGQANPFEQISLFWEDRMLREVRVRRLENERNWSQQPPTRSTRLLGSIAIEGVDAAGLLIVRSSLHMTEWRRELRHLCGTVFHKLEATPGGGWKIQLKRVDLVNCDDTFANLEVFI